METEKLIGAFVAAFVILFIAGFLVHSVWLGATYRQMRDAGFRSVRKTRCATSSGAFG